PQMPVCPSANLGRKTQSKAPSRSILPSGFYHTRVTPALVLPQPENLLRPALCLQCTCSKESRSQSRLSGSRNRKSFGAPHLGAGIDLPSPHSHACPRRGIRPRPYAMDSCPPQVLCPGKNTGLHL